jgi:hypothetical protein
MNIEVDLTTKKAAEAMRERCAAVLDRLFPVELELCAKAVFYTALKRPHLVAQIRRRARDRRGRAQLCHGLAMAGNQHGLARLLHLIQQGGQVRLGLKNADFTHGRSYSDQNGQNSTSFTAGTSPG